MIVSTPSMCRSLVYAFPEAVLGPGEERYVVAVVTGVFRPQKLVVVAFMRPIRGYFRIKRSRLPALDREDVVAYTRVYKCRRGKKVWFRPGKTTVEFRGNIVQRSFVREYLPSSVEYVHIDPLEYIVIRNLSCDKAAGIPTTKEGASALFFGPGILGNGLSLPTPNQSMSLLLLNKGDIQVRVRASIFGVGLMGDNRR